MKRLFAVLISAVVSASVFAQTVPTSAEPDPAIVKGFDCVMFDVNVEGKPLFGLRDMEGKELVPALYDRIENCGLFLELYRGSVLDVIVKGSFTTLFSVEDAENVVLTLTRGVFIVEHSNGMKAVVRAADGRYVADLIYNSIVFLSETSLAAYADDEWLLYDIAKDNTICAESKRDAVLACGEKTLAVVKSGLCTVTFYDRALNTIDTVSAMEARLLSDKVVAAVNEPEGYTVLFDYDGKRLARVESSVIGEENGLNIFRMNDDTITVLADLNLYPFNSYDCKPTSFSAIGDKYCFFNAQDEVIEVLDKALKPLKKVYKSDELVFSREYYSRHPEYNEEKYGMRRFEDLEVEFVIMKDTTARTYVSSRNGDDVYFYSLRGLKRKKNGYSFVDRVKIGDIDISIKDAMPIVRNYTTKNFYFYLPVSNGDRVFCLTARDMKLQDDVCYFTLLNGATARTKNNYLVADDNEGLVPCRDEFLLYSNNGAHVIILDENLRVKNEYDAGAGYVVEAYFISDNAVYMSCRKENASVILRLDLSDNSCTEYSDDAEGLYRVLASGEKGILVEMGGIRKEILLESFR